MNKKKILLFSDWFYPGYKAGGPIQSAYNLISHLSDYYDFSVVTRDTDYTDTVPYENIKSDSWNILPNKMRVYYFSKKKLSFPNMNKLIKNEKFDIAYLNGMYSPRFTIMPLLILHKMDKRIILCPRGMLAPTAIAIKSWKKKPFLLWIKNSNIIKNMRFHAASLHEAEHIRAIFEKKCEIKIAPNLPDKLDLPALISKKKEAGSVNLFSIARVSPEKNLHFALEVLMQCQGKIRFSIYGPVYDEAYWSTCKTIMTKLPANIEVSYLGPVAKQDIPDALKSEHFLFLPTLGENFGHSILEAMTNGCPPIISNATMWKGLEKVQAGYDISLKEPASYVKVINDVVNIKQSEYDAMVSGTRAFAQNFIGNPELIKQSIDIFNYN